MKIKSGQSVQVLTGKDKGKTGQVIQVFPKLDKLVVDGVNKAYKHLKRQQMSGGQKGERVEYFSPIHASNVKVVVEAVEKKSTEKEVKPAKKKETTKTSK